ncbi:MazG nucleotide pyrophosphohydrolase domain-containing protein [Pseudoalteromonas umbrosa]|uniref:MazG nucleotide pyrophosphohydrolase domain-containing protein n=1 Tax=Pseudoalteromonas umbrosa TaxID=3048489 RepID=UPI0024C3ADE9|nr:MazG nucleotide pyrophosphohydrolase domain-containing protein [Pseudoalteromonas sp. B95]MDK1286312.1 MazG nucleotide pyrophosphohydrolase domain-containing protein [Pseudoalteromonas sp. B95]
MSDLENLLAIAQRKFIFDQTNSWYSGSNTYLSALQDEVSEVLEEIPKQRKCHLEDELGDILWNYLNIILALEKETGIDMGSVVQRAVNKYEQRISAIEQGGSWAEVKEKQKRALEKEHSESAKPRFHNK